MKPFTPHSHQAKKRLGQNFLQDQTIIDRIVRVIRPLQSDQMIEIGPGLGALTKAILSLAGQIKVIELDQTVLPKLIFNCDGLGKLDIYQQDALKTDFAELANNRRIRVVGNLPYNISTPLLFHLFQYLSCIEDMHFMLQKEVVERMVAGPGSKTYGRLSVMTQLVCQCELLFLVPPEAFIPAPKVDSAIVRLKPRSSALELEDKEVFSAMVSEAFSQRRKTLRNVWKHRFSEGQIESLQIDPRARPECLSVDNFVQAANFYVNTNSLDDKQ